LTDYLNAEISLGTVTNMEEAIAWLSYSYLYVRMRKNPQVYGIKYQELREDPTLLAKRREIINDAAKRLDKAKMIRYDESNGIMSFSSQFTNVHPATHLIDLPEKKYK
jgi:replicative superfamily II helicase